MKAKISLDLWYWCNFEWQITKKQVFSQTSIYSNSVPVTQGSDDTTLFFYTESD